MKKPKFEKKIKNRIIISEYIGVTLVIINLLLFVLGGIFMLIGNNDLVSTGAGMFLAGVIMSFFTQFINIW